VMAVSHWMSSMWIRILQRMCAWNPFPN